jgi:protein O-mannosyl-transferase
MLFFAFSLFTKEIAPVIIPLALLYIYLIEKENLLSFNARILTAGWLPLLALWFLMRRAASNSFFPVVSANMIKNIILNLSAVVIYAGKLLLPFNLSVMAYMRDSSLAYGSLALALVAVLLLFSKRKRLNHIIFGSLWFLLFLLPAFVYSDPSGFGDYVYEHRIYLPAIGLMIVLLETDLLKDLDMENIRTFIIGALILSILTFMTLIHIGDFRDRISFYESAVRTAPHSPLAHKNLGAMYYLDGSMDKAEFETKKAIAINPSEPLAHNNLGLVYMNKGMFKRAEYELLKEISINPNYADVYYNLSLLYAKQKRR